MAGCWFCLETSASWTPALRSAWTSVPSAADPTEVETFRPFRSASVCAVELFGTTTLLSAPSGL